VQIRGSLRAPPSAALEIPSKSPAREEGRKDDEERKNRLASLKQKITPGFRFVIEVYYKFEEDHGLLLAAGIAFSILMCIIPIVLLILAFAGTYLVDHRELLDYILQYAANLFPAVDPQITKNLSRIIQDRQIVGILGVGGIAWASTWVFSNLRSALNLIFGVKKGRGLLRGKLVDMAMILLCSILLLISLGITGLVTFIGAYLPRFPLSLGSFLQWTLKYFIPFLFTFLMFFSIYKIAPRKKISFQVAFKAALFTGLLWEVAKLLFSWYVLHLGKFALIYGSLGTLAVLFFWIYYSSALFIVGGVMAAVLEDGKKGGPG
jgi:membrane protein